MLPQQVLPQQLIAVFAIQVLHLLDHVLIQRGLQRSSRKGYALVCRHLGA